MGNSIKFFVPGLPKSAGSKTAIRLKTGATIVKDACDNEDWKASVAFAAAKAMEGLPVMTGPVVLGLEFNFLRPKAHYGTGRNAGKLKASAPCFHTKKPDLTKITRCIEDAMTGIVYRDDSLIFDHSPCRKGYGDKQGCQVYVSEI